MTWLKLIIQFIRDVAQDPRIPERDKTVIMALAMLIVSPLDLIPDWIPFLGILDDLILLALILDYFFSVLEQSLLLSHYPWGIKSFIMLKKSAHLLSWWVPDFLKDKIWQYRPPPI